MEKEKTIEELKDHIEKVKGLIEYHVITAAEYFKQIAAIESIIANREKKITPVDQAKVEEWRKNNPEYMGES